MVNYYKSDIIPIILNRFKVNDIVIKGFFEEEIMNQVLMYCNDNDVHYSMIDLFENSDEKMINNLSLDTLNNFTDYGAIFLNGDPNWYTIFNELNIIKEKNKEFPLVFICNNIFPHKRRDSYINPKVIPIEFLNDYTDHLIYNGINIKDGLFHAIEESACRNGVLTAIEDFINENSSIGIMRIKFLNGITILYQDDTISKIRIGRIFEEISGKELEYDDFSDNIFKNQILTNHIINHEINEDDLNNLKEELDKKDKVINDFENQIDIQDIELNLKNSQIDNIDSKLDLKETQIKNIESKLINRDVEINNLNSKLNSLNNEINSLKSQIVLNDQKELELNNKLKVVNDKIQYQVSQLTDKDNQIFELYEREKKFDSIKQQYRSQLSKLDNKNYCISCYKEEIDNNNLEIEYLKKDNMTKKILSPFAYVYLIFKSKPNELLLNFKLYKLIKNSKCFDIGFYLNNNKDIQESKWCKYFSPELHYVCNGFNEERKFNKKYYNRNSKKELLEYILNCNQ